MRKGLGLICFIIGLCAAFSACSNNETYADKLKNERKSISRLINEKNIIVLNSYPASGVFKENEYFRDPLTGVYINVIDSGNGNRASITKRSEVSVRYTDVMTFGVSAPDTASNTYPGYQPLSFVYGITATYSGSSVGTPAYSYLSPGIVAPLEYVGENARVRLIVPFSSGSTLQLATFTPLYYTQLQYTRIVN